MGGTMTAATNMRLSTPAKQGTATPTTRTERFPRSLGIVVRFRRRRRLELESNALHGATSPRVQLVTETCDLIADQSQRSAHWESLVHDTISELRDLGSVTSARVIEFDVSAARASTSPSEHLTT